MKFTSCFAFVALAASSLPSVFAASSFGGSNLYYASGLKAADQQTLLAGLKSAGVQVLRVWLDGVSGTVKGTQVNNIPSLEGFTPGQYDDTVLEHLDDFMVAANSYGIKLLVSIYSYNALAANQDYYGKDYGITNFYTSSQAITQYKARIAHVLSHVNPNNGKSWAQSSEYIFAFETQNEAMHEQQDVSALESWQCEIAGAIKQNLNGNTNILVSTGGGAFLSNSLLAPYFSCDALDVLAIHAYGTGDFATSALQPYVAKAKAANKLLIMQEWGSCYTTASNNNCNGGSPLSSSTRDANIKSWAASIAAAGIPAFYWQILPNEDPHQGWDYEVGIGGVNWAAMKSASLAAASADAAFDFGPYLLTTPAAGDGGGGNGTASASASAAPSPSGMTTVYTATAAPATTDANPATTDAAPATTDAPSAPTLAPSGGGGYGAGNATCEWAGHCAGAPCECYDDCSGSMVCTAGKCAPL